MGIVFCSRMSAMGNNIHCVGLDLSLTLKGDVDTIRFWLAPASAVYICEPRVPLKHCPVILDLLRVTISFCPIHTN
jgi:hypothetical protein